MFRSLDFSHERDIDIDELVRRMEAHYPDANFDLLRKAYDFAEKAHSGQKRSSGEDYFIHPINVSATLIKLRIDMNSVISGLLHDVIEDCDVEASTLEKEFNKRNPNLKINGKAGDFDGYINAHQEQNLNYGLAAY